MSRGGKQRFISFCIIILSEKQRALMEIMESVTVDEESDDCLDRWVGMIAMGAKVRRGGLQHI